MLALFAQNEFGRSNAFRHLIGQRSQSMAHYERRRLFVCFSVIKSQKKFNENETKKLDMFWIW
jgi:hypothetical protein